MFGCAAVVDAYDDGVAFVDYGTAPAGVIGGSAEGEAAAVEIDEDRV